MQKKFFLTLSLCCFTFFNMVSMNPKSKYQRFENFKTRLIAISNNDLNTVSNEDDLEEAAALVALDKEFYRPLVFIAHSDKSGNNNPILGGITRALNSANQKHRAPVEIAQPTPEDMARETILRKKDAILKQIESFEKYIKIIETNSPATLEFMDNLSQAQQALSHSFIQKVVKSLFDLNSDRVIMTRYPEDSPVRQAINTGRNNVEILKHNQTVLNFEKEQEKDYNFSLQKIQAHYDKAIQEKLKKYL